MEKKIFEILLECTEGTSNKFWRAAAVYEALPVKSSRWSVQIRYGLRGQEGTSYAKHFESSAKTFAHLNGKLKEKSTHGYRIVDIMPFDISGLPPGTMADPVSIMKETDRVIRSHFTVPPELSVFGSSASPKAVMVEETKPPETSADPSLVDIVRTRTANAKVIF